MKEILIKLKAWLVGDGFEKGTQGAKSLGAATDQAGTKLGSLRERMSACIAKSGMLAGAMSAVGSIALNLAGSALLRAGQGLAGMAQWLVGGTKAAADFAGSMSDLSARTGESVGSVVVLRQAFINAGLGGEAVGQALNMLQKSLSGVNEEGKPTAEVFARLGLSIDSLKQMSAADQLQAISVAIGSLPTPADQARAAMEMFGRAGGQMLAILKDAGAIDTAREQVGKLAENLQASAADLDKFSDAVGSLDVKQMQFFAGFAKGISGDLADAADVMNRMDFSGPGKELGIAAAGAAELARELASVAAILDRLPGVGEGNGVGVVGDAAKAVISGFVPGAGAVMGGWEFLHAKGTKRNAALLPKPEAPKPAPSTLDEEMASLSAKDAREKARKEAEDGLRAAEQQARFNAADDKGKAFLLDKQIAANKSVLGDDMWSPEQQAAAAERLVKLTAQRAELESKIAETAKQKAEKAAKEEKEKIEKRRDFDADLAISEAEAAGKTEEAKKLRWNRDREKLQRELEEMGDADSWSKSARMTKWDAASKEKPGGSAPLSDRLREIGIFNTGRVVQSERTMSAIERWTSETAAATKKLAEKPAAIQEPANMF